MNNQSSNNNPLRPAALLAALLLAGCAAIPPVTPAPSLAAPQAADFAPAANGEWPAASWWQQFHDSQLDTLVQQALADSPSMTVAAARLQAARAGAQATRAAAGVALDADASLTRERFTDYGVIPPPYAGKTFYDGEAALDFSWDVDFWGRNRAAIQASLGQVRASQAEQAGSAATLSTAVASAYYQWQALNARIALQQDMETSRRQLVTLESALVKAGLSPGQNLAPLAADAAGPRLSIAQLSAQRDQALFQLRSLVNSGKDFPALQAAPLPAVSGGLPAGLDLDLLARRADIAAARDRVEASLQTVKSDRAAFYPDVDLKAFVGLSSLDMGEMLHYGARTYGATPAIHLPVFDAPRLHAALAGSQADAAVAAAEYDQTVQNAVAEVNDAALRLQGVDSEKAALSAQTEARQRDLANASRLHQAGLADGREVERRRLALLGLKEQEVSREQRALLADIDLIKALGGGYSAPQTASK